MDATSRFASSPDTSRVFIVILNWNGIADTLECLASVKKLDYPSCRTIVVDHIPVTEPARTILDVGGRVSDGRLHRIIEDARRARHRWRTAAICRERSRCSSASTVRRRIPAR